mgnify:FL=1
MMELSVWEQGEQIGTVTAQQDGLFYIFICKISQHAEQLRRIYVISKWRVEYLGIPYPRREGAELQACIPVSHFPDGLTAAAAAAMPRGAWLPWCGEAGGVPIRNGLLKQLEDGYALALLPEEAQQLPQWLLQAAEQELMGRARLVFRLDAAGCMPSIETTENGGSTDEAQNFSDPFAGSVPSDAAPGDGDGRAGDGDPLKGRQADRPDI